MRRLMLLVVLLGLLCVPGPGPAHAAAVPAPAVTAPPTDAPPPVVPPADVPPTPAPAAVPPAPVPATPAFGPFIDDYAPWVGETTCSPAAKPGAVRLGELLGATYAPSSIQIGRRCSAAASGHEEGRAVDWMRDSADPAQDAQVRSVIAWLTAPDAHGNPHAMARRLGVSYLMYGNEIWRAWPRSGQPAFTPAPQTVGVKGVATPCAALPATHRTTCHRDHLHISLSWDGAYGRTSFWNADASTWCPEPATALSAAPAPDGRALPYVSLPSPRRLLDTRTGEGVAAPCRAGPGRRIDLQVAGRGGLPETGVGAVVLNVAGVRPGAGTHLTVWPAGGPQPGTSTVNLAEGENRASLVVVPVGAGGQVSVANRAGTTDVVIDVVGYHPAAAGDAPRAVGALAYHPLSPARIADTRTAGTGAPLRARGVLEVPVAGLAGVPATGAASVVVNVTVDAPAAAGFLSLTPAPPRGTPTTSTLNFTAGRQVANRAYAQLSPSGSLHVYASAATSVVVDVVGWFGPEDGAPGSGDLVPVTPVRVLDTRGGAGAVGGLTTFGARTAQSFDVTGSGAVPAGTRAVLATLTGTRSTAATYVTAWPGGAARPVASDLNLAKGRNVANLVVIPVGADGTIDLYNYRGSLDLVLDLLGYYRTPAAALVAGSP